MTFLHKNIKTTTSFGTRIIPKIIPKFQEKEFYNKYKINKLPASVYNKENYVGQDRIKSLIKILCKNKKPLRRKNDDELADEELREYHQSVMDSGDEEEQTDDIESRKMQAAMMTQQRMEGMNDNSPASYQWKDKDMGMDMDTDMGNNAPIVSDREDNIYSEIQDMAHEGSEDDHLMDALLEKIRGANE